MELDIVKVTSKGQIVIPRDIRRELKIKKGERFLAYDRGDSIILKRLKDIQEKSSEKELESVFTQAWKIARKRGVSKVDVEREIQAYRRKKDI